MSIVLPSAAVGLSVAVLVYSAVCITLSTLLTCLLISFGEAWSYVTIVSGAASLGTLASIGQQMHYCANWDAVKADQYSKAVRAQTQKGLAFGGAAGLVDVVLFYIQFYTYNVITLNIFFWTVALFTGAWGIRSVWLGRWYSRVPIISKIFSVTFPILVIGLMQIKSIKREAAALLTLAYFAMVTSMLAGSTLLVLTLYKYIKTRRLVAGNAHRRGRWWASDTSKSKDDNVSGGTVDPGALNTRRRSIYDRALVTRFTIGFVLLSIFEIAIISFTLFQSDNTKAIVKAGKPDYSLRSAQNDILLFLPGVTPSLALFLVFGTTKSWRQYRDLVFGCCGLRSKVLYKKRQLDEEVSRAHGTEFERLPSIYNRQSIMQSNAMRDPENQLHLFSFQLNRDTKSVAESSAPKPALHLQIPSNSRVNRFHRQSPVTAAPATITITTATTIEYGKAVDMEPLPGEKEPKWPQAVITARSRSSSDETQRPAKFDNSQRTNYYGDATLYISNLPASMTESELNAIFMEYNVKKCKILRDAQNNSRGNAFVLFENRDVCGEIISKFHGQPTGEEGLLLRVYYADIPRSAPYQDHDVGAHGGPAETIALSSPMKSSTA